MDFQAGRFFSNKEKWTLLVDTLIENGIDMPSWLVDGFSSGLNPYHKTLVLKNPNHFKFKGYHFRDFEHLKKRQFNNFNEFSDTVLNEKLDELIKSHAIEEISAQEVEADPESIISPIYLFECSNQKKRLIYHDKNNVFYSRPHFEMANVHTDAESIMVMGEGLKMDLASGVGGFVRYFVIPGFFSGRLHLSHLVFFFSSFYQFPVCASARPRMRFKVNGRYFQWLVLSMGSSASPLIVHESMKALRSYYSLKISKNFISHFLDDPQGFKKICFGSARNSRKGAIFEIS